jgi:hypothetical protein
VPVDKRITTGYTVESRVGDDGKPIYAVIREHRYRGKSGAQMVTTYKDVATADSVAATLNTFKSLEY